VAGWALFRARVYRVLVNTRRARGLFRVDVETGACYRWKVKCYWTGSFRLLWTSFAAPRSDIYPSHLGPSRSTGKIVIYRRCRHALSLSTVSPRATVAVFGDNERTVETLRGSATREYVASIIHDRIAAIVLIASSVPLSMTRMRRDSCDFFPSSFSSSLFSCSFFLSRIAPNACARRSSRFSESKILLSEIFMAVKKGIKGGRNCRVRARRTIAN